jgi:hypothetical protein
MTEQAPHQTGVEAGLMTKLGQYSWTAVATPGHDAHLGAVLGISDHGCLLEGADAVEASAAAGQVTDRTERMTAMLARGPATFSDLERCVYPQKCTT